MEVVKKQFLETLIPPTFNKDDKLPILLLAPDPLDHILWIVSYNETNIEAVFFNKKTKEQKITCYTNIFDIIKVRDELILSGWRKGFLPDVKIY